MAEQLGMAGRLAKSEFCGERPGRSSFYVVTVKVQFSPSLSESLTQKLLAGSYPVSPHMLLWLSLAKGQIPSEAAVLHTCRSASTTVFFDIVTQCFTVFHNIVLSL